MAEGAVEVRHWLRSRGVEDARYGVGKSVDAATARPLTTPSEAFPSTVRASGNNPVTARRTYGARDMPPVR